MNARNGEGRTALHLAVRLGVDLEIVSKLLEANADRHLTDSDGLTLLQYALGGGDCSNVGEREGYDQLLSLLQPEVDDQVSG